MKAKLAQWDQADKDAHELGVLLAGEIPGREPSGIEGTGFKSNVCTAILDSMSQAQPDHECIEQFLRWTFERYWGIEVERHLPLFDEYWTWLNDNNARRNNPLVWGDVDCSAWVEFPKAESRRVLVVETHCAMRDDNVHLFIRDNGVLFNHFHVRTCWPRTTRVKGYGKGAKGWDWVKHPSLALYREMDFKLPYADCRDSGYCISYEQVNRLTELEGVVVRPGKVDNGHSAMLDIYWALWTLRGVGGGIEHPCELPRPLGKEGGERKDV